MFSQLGLFELSGVSTDCALRAELVPRSANATAKTRRIPINERNRVTWEVSANVRRFVARKRFLMLEERMCIAESNRTRFYFSGTEHFDTSRDQLTASFRGNGCLSVDRLAALASSRLVSAFLNELDRLVIWFFAGEQQCQINDQTSS